MENQLKQCEILIQKTFPSIDDELYQYINDVLRNSIEDFANGFELYEAIGEILHEINSQSSLSDIQNFCNQLHGCFISSSIGENQSSNKVLDTPMSLNNCIGQPDTSPTGIWLDKSRIDSKVDAKKLEKAEQQILKKQLKDSGSGSAKVQTNRYKNNEATASQIISKNRIDANAGNSKDIRLEGVDISFGDKALIRAADINLVYGRRYGFVGRNGLGKSTLLHMLSSQQLVISSSISILHVEQEVAGDDTQALQSVLKSDVKRESLLQEEKDINLKLATGEALPELNSRLSSIYTELELMESDKAPSRASVILAGLGFTSEMQNRCTKTFSGGWRMRLALARALFCRPDLLLLDEPTNMLDMQAIIWLERYLQSWPATLLVVSHDRNFLDEVATDILHLHSMQINTYRGNYSDFVSTMTERLKAQQREYEAQMEHRKHVQEFIDKFRYNAKRASLVQSRIKQLEKLRELKCVEKEAEVTLKFPEVDKLSPPILMLNDVRFSYDGKNDIFKNVDLSATMESRICIVGENGAGKTTLLKLIMEKITATSGIRTAHRNLKFGFFTQHHVDQLDMTVCPVELMQHNFPGKKVEEYRRMLGQFGISGELALQQTCSLSGGQKSRVAFAILCGHQPNFLVLDEPTNHLDIQTIEALGLALTKYKGGVILVSHDERLIRIVCQELWVCSQGRVYSMEGGFDEYRKKVENELILS